MRVLPDLLWWLWTDRFGGWAHVLRRDPCAYCGAKATTIDHIRPRHGRSRDYYSDIGNLTGACGPCNQDKGTMPLLVYLALRQLRAREDLNTARRLAGMPSWGRILKAARHVWPLDFARVTPSRRREGRRVPLLTPALDSCEDLSVRAFLFTPSTTTAAAAATPTPRAAR